MIEYKVSSPLDILLLSLRTISSSLRIASVSTNLHIIALRDDGRHQPSYGSEFRQNFMRLAEVGVKRQLFGLYNYPEVCFVRVHIYFVSSPTHMKCIFI